MMQTFKDVLGVYAKPLKSVSDNPQRDLRVLLGYVQHTDPSVYILDPMRHITPEELERLHALLARRLLHEPLSKIINMREFYGRSFKVTQDTLDPRCDSETLIDAVLRNRFEHCGGANQQEESRHLVPFFKSEAPVSANTAPRLEEMTAPMKGAQSTLKHTEIEDVNAAHKSTAHTSRNQTIKNLHPKGNTKDNTPAAWERILDLGTGTGCLGLTLLMEMPHARAVGVDISSAALKVAKENAKTWSLEARIEFREGTWCAPLRADEKFSIIVSNPPYVEESAPLDANVRNFDPHIALFAGKDGLDAYKSLVPQLVTHLVPGGIVALEFGQGQEHGVRAICNAHGLKLVRFYKDIQGITRCGIFEAYV